MLENLPLQVFLHATFRKLHSPGKPSCLLIIYNPCFSHYLNYYPCNLSCLCLTCLPSVASSVEWGVGLALSRSLLLSESSSNSNKSCICLIMPLLHTLLSLDLMEKPPGTFGLQNRSPRSSEGPMLYFPCEHSSTSLHWGPRTRKGFRVPEGGSYSWLKNGVEERTEIGENITINGENPIPCWQEYFVSHGYFLLNTELLWAD